MREKSVASAISSATSGGYFTRLEWPRLVVSRVYFKDFLQIELNINM